MRKISLVIMALGIISVVAAGTFADFSDVEVSADNTFGIGKWKWWSAGDLYVDTGCACIGCCGQCCCVQCPCGHGLHCIEVKNVGEYDIKIDKVSVSWNPDYGENITGVWVFDWDCSTKIEVWNGSEPAGTVLDIVDLTLNPWKSPNIFTFVFDSNMKQKTTFTIRFFMDDSSSKTVMFTPEVMECGGG